MKAAATQTANAANSINELGQIMGALERLADQDHVQVSQMPMTSDQANSISADFQVLVTMKRKVIQAI